MSPIPHTPRQLASISPSLSFLPSILSVALSPNGRTLATGDDDGTVRLWDIAEPAHPHPLGQPLIGNGPAVPTVAFSSDGRILATGSLDGAARLWCR